jgi:serine/threonine protein kinase
VGEGLEIGPYRIVRRLALGERGEVLLARVYGPHGFRRTVVLKRLIGSHASDPLWLRRLAAEAIAYARLSHSAIVRLYDFVEIDGAPALVLEYVPGVSLEALVKAKRDRGERLGDPEIFYVGARVFAALAAAHGARNPETGEFSPVIHRDVSPGNVLVSTHGEVKLTDFGVARVAGVTDETPSGTLLGTYGYMAPEQISGEGITVRADVYGAGLLLWELLAGRHAFQRDSLPELEMLQAMAQPRIPPIDRLRPNLPPSICEALSLALRANADERIGAREMLDVLRLHVKSSTARATLADELGAACRPRSMLPDGPPARAWTAYAAAIDPDATSESALSTVSDPEDAVASTAASETEPGATPTAPLARPFFGALGAQRWSLRQSLPVPASRSRYISDTPTAIVTQEGRGPAPSVRVEPQLDGRRLALLASIGAVLLVGIAIGSSGTQGKPPQSPVAAPTRSARSFLASPLRERAAVRGRAERTSFPTDAFVGDATGRLDTPPSMWNHRVFVDGFVRGAGGDSIRVRCGRHTVRLGSAGRTQSVDVPCGGQVMVGR